MVEGYFDESGDLDQPPGVFCVAGYFVGPEAAKAMDKDWGAVLQEYGLPYFHMVDCAHGAPPFDKLHPTARVAVETKLINIIKRYTLEGFAAVMQRDNVDGGVDAYGELVEMAVYSLYTFLMQHRIDDKLAFFFERGHTGHGRAYSKVADKLREISVSLSFAEKKELRLLQAADLLAWQVTKYVKDEISKARPMRKDFRALMEHPHSIFHILNKGGKKSLALEAFPLSRRSAKDISLEISPDSAPLTYLTGEGDGVVIPIEKAESWRVGAGRMAYVTFTDAGKKRFHLAFDERRLLETSSMFLQSLAAFPEMKVSLLLPASGIAFVRESDAVILQIELINGARLAIALDPNEFDKLRN